MEQELISKKELLEMYGISYGALYRWKRKGLIPEEWFIKKSTVTGQETFFPRRLICERMELIKAQKDDISLDGISDLVRAASTERAAVVIDTVFGKRKIYFDEIKSIVIDHGNGETTDVMSRIVGEEKK